MRSILFKAKKLSDGKWVKGSLVKTPFGTFIEWYEDSICNKREVDTDTVCQSTGLEDCEGNEIWEGDIIDFSGEGEVVFKDGAFYAKFGKYAECLLCNLIKSGQSVTIVGNKFDKEK